MNNTAIFAIFRDQTHAEAGVASLVQAGFRRDDVSVLLADSSGTKDLAHEKHTKAPEGAAAGAGAGVVIGGALGLLAGLGTIVLPGLGIFLVAGPIMGALAGAGSVGVARGSRRLRHLKAQLRSKYPRLRPLDSPDHIWSRICLPRREPTTRSCPNNSASAKLQTSTLRSQIRRSAPQLALRPATNAFRSKAKRMPI